MQEAQEPASALPAQPSIREMIHRLNNQLTIVIAHAECSLDSQEPEAMRHSLRAILDAGTNMAEAVRALSRATPRPDSTLSGRSERKSA